MATGNTTTSSLADSLEDVIMSARIIREQEGGMAQLVEQQILERGKGTGWTEITYDKLTAQAITETTELDNPQQVSDTSRTIIPTVVGIQTIITDRVAARITPKGFAKIGALAQNAIQRKKDQDGLTVLDGFSNSYCGAGSTLTSGHIGAAKALISGNATEPGNPPYRGVLHSYQIHDIEDEIIAGVGTYPVAEGLTARVFKEGFRGMINMVQLYENGNITIDADDDAKGGVFAQEAIILVQGRTPWIETKRAPQTGGGATELFQYDEYAYGERKDDWGVEIYSDATAPTS